MAEKKVVIRGGTFDPATLEISIGDSVVWQNDDTRIHNATAQGGGKPNTGNIDPGRSSSPQIFEKATSSAIQYRCTLHPEMSGRVSVGSHNHGDGGDTDEQNQASLESDFRKDDWLKMAQIIAATWVYDLSDDIVHAMSTHTIEDTDSRTCIRDTYDLIQSEWDDIQTWWAKLIDADTEFFSRGDDATWESRRDELMKHSMQRLEALGGKLRAAYRQLSPLVFRFPFPGRSDDGLSPGEMFPGQSSDPFGTAITVNGVTKPVRDAYMDHQNFVGAAYRIQNAIEAGEPISEAMRKNYASRKAVMSPLHYNLLAYHQYTGLSAFFDSSDFDEEKFSEGIWRFTVRGEMDGVMFSSWHWLKWIEAHLAILETNKIPDIVCATGENETESM